MRSMVFRSCVTSLVLLSFALAEVSAAQTASQAERRTIFDYKEDLTLSNDQEGRIRSILADLNKDLRLARARLTILQYDLEDLLKKEGDLGAIKKNLSEQAELRAEARFADIAATRRVNSVLSKKQLTKWRAVQAAARETQGLKAEKQRSGS